MQRSLSGAWRIQDTMLTSTALSVRYRAAAGISSPWWLALWGFRYGRPWSVVVHSVLVALLLVAAMAYDAWDLSTSSHESGDRSLHVLNNETTLVVAGGVVVSLALLNLGGFRQEGSVAVTTVHLTEHSIAWNYDARWKRKSQYSNAATVLIWVTAVAAEVLLHVGSADIDGLREEMRNPEAHIGAFAIIAGLFCAICLYVQNVNNGLAAMVDSYCAKLVGAEDLSGLKIEWNILQALLRRSAEGMGPCLVVICLTPVVVVVMSTMELLMSDTATGGVMLAVLLPKLVLGFSVCQLALGIARISGTCARVPVFLNSVLLGVGDDDPRASRLIHFIERSHAGFYVCDTKVDFATMSKFAYIIGAATLTLITKAVV